MITPSGIWVAESLRDEEKDVPMNWEPFIGNNHATLPRRAQWGGKFEFAEHLGKPLTQNLWDQICKYTPLMHIRVFKPNDAMWCDAPSNIIYIHLDDKGNVRDIKIRFGHMI